REISEVCKTGILYHRKKHSRYTNSRKEQNYETTIVLVQRPSSVPDRALSERAGAGGRASGAVQRPNERDRHGDRFFLPVRDHECGWGGRGNLSGAFHIDREGSH